ncbi:unnamed protein product [Ranitomeya imitator]|uniref:Uncharacterized protein n=1 Tax=Ranitomeya imitator TaxID=111125 RepID=A0ABN9KTR2_9NEOB|nr:unnamed protein product [Ranitomeya imitator]
MASCDSEAWTGDSKGLAMVGVVNSVAEFTPVVTSGTAASELPPSGVLDWAFSLAPGDPALSNVNAFFLALGLLYDEPNSVDQAEKNLLALCQGQDDIEVYCQKFRKWSVLTLWNESALAALFRKGLSEALKDVMVGFPMPAGLNESMSLAIQIGRRLRERKSVHHLVVLSKIKPEPMQCDRTMTRVERQEHRHLNGLCFYCGDSTHAISDCPKRTKRFDRKFSAAERNYDVGNRELLAMKWAFEEWRHWLEGAKHRVVVLTDHKNLTYLESAKRLNPRQARWSLFFARFDFVISYLPGSKNVKADALSRSFVPDSPGSSEPASILKEGVIVSVISPDLRRVLQKFQANKPDRCPAERLFVPDGWTSKVISELHCSVLAGHPGIFGTRELVARSFWWPSLSRDTNGQTKRTNQTLETYLRCFVSADQDDWVSFLPLAEFALNNRASSATLVSPFFCNSGFHPRFSSGQVESSDCPGVDSVVDRLQQIWTQVVVAEIPMVPSVEPPAPVLVEGELEYIVEKILDSRVSRRKLQCLVKWKGYAQEDNSWVFASDVHAPDLVRAFHGTVEGLDSLISHLKNNNLNIRLTYHHHNSCIEFLDVFIKHNDFEIRAVELKTRFLDRGFSHRSIKRAYNRAKHSSRNELLYSSSKPSKTMKVRFITNYHAENHKMRHVLKKAWPILLAGEALSKYLPKEPSITFRRSKNIRDTLVNSHYQSSSKTFLNQQQQKKGSFQCGHCIASPNIERVDTFSDSSGSKNFTIRHFINCETKVVIYYATCTCPKIYVGLTTHQFKVRVREHVNGIISAQNENDQSVLKTIPRHFKQFHNCDTSCLRVRGIDKIARSIRRGNISQRLAQMETRWIWVLDMIQPGGLNNNISFIPFLCLFSST